MLALEVEVFAAEDFEEDLRVVDAFVEVDFAPDPEAALPAVFLAVDARLVVFFFDAFVVFVAMGLSRRSGLGAAFLYNEKGMRFREICTKQIEGGDRRFGRQLS